MLPIEKQFKETFNLIIRYYRRYYSLHDTRYLSKNFIYDKRGVQICDISTLSKLENNKLLCSDTIYYALFENLNFSLTYSLDANRLITNTNAHLIRLAETNDVKKIIQTLPLSIKVLKKFKNCVMYNEYLEIYQLFLEYYTSTSYNLEQIEKYHDLFEIMDDRIKSIYITIAYNYYSRVNIITEKSQAIINLLTTYKSTSIMYTYLLSTYYVRLENTIKVKEICETILTRCKLENNSFYISKAYNNIAYVFSEIKTSAAIKYIEKAINFFDYENDSTETLNVYYRNYANLLYKCHNYQEVINIYENKLKGDVKFFQAFFIFLISSYKNLHYPKEKIQNILNELDVYSSKLSPFLKLTFDLYYSIYIDNNFSKTKKCILGYQEHIDFLKLSGPFSEIIISDIKEACMLNHANPVYKAFMKLFQKNRNF